MAKTSFTLILLVASFVGDTGANSCSWGNFYCSRSNQCKSSQWRCDGDRDCTYGDDESGCQTACSNRRTQFRCNNNHCITRSYVCDGDNDCGDNSDEFSYLCGVRRTSSTLRCYRCSSSSSSCYSTTCAYFYGRGYCYKKTADRTTGGSTSRVTIAGCRSSCTSSEKVNACLGERNCQMTCCSTSLCNRVSSSGDSAYPSCYTCTSASSYQDCKNMATLTRCGSTIGTAYCYKMDYKMSSTYGSVSVYRKGCTTSSSACRRKRSSTCNTGMTDKCNVYCCTGSGCNASSIQRFSLVVLVSCAVAFFIL